MKPMFVGEPQLNHLFDLVLEVGQPIEVGQTPQGERRVIQVTGGSFEGEQIKGRVISGGDDWIVVRPDNVRIQDVRIILETDEQDLILMKYSGIRHGPASVIERLDRNEEVDPSEYYFRTAPVFETASPKYGWLNSAFAIATGRRVCGKALYSVFTIS